MRHCWGCVPFVECRTQLWDEDERVEQLAVVFLITEGFYLFIYLFK